jgi:hypothetical protein
LDQLTRDERDAVGIHCLPQFDDHLHLDLGANHRQRPHQDDAEHGQWQTFLGEHLGDHGLHPSQITRPGDKRPDLHNSFFPVP